MSDSVIEVENLGKHFIIGHQQTERYTALRDVIARNAKNMIRKATSLAKEKTVSDSSTEEFWALNDVNFTVERGDRVGIIGRNGAGKSTLLKILSRITEPSKGKIIIRGRVASLLEVGTGFHPELSGRENIYLNGAILGMSRSEIRKKFDEIVAFAEVEKFLDTPVKRYSSGMYVRLAFAVAAHLEPEILVVDEVLAVGDAQFQKKCLGKLEDVSKNEGRTVLFVSHNLTALQAICNKGIYLQKGLLKGSGDIQSQIQHYFNDSANSSSELDNIIGTLSLKSIDIVEKKLVSLGTLAISFQFEAIENDIIQSLVVLINNSLGQRVAIVDLRQQIAFAKIAKGQQIKVDIKVRSIPFLQGDYEIGLFYHGEKGMVNSYNLKTVNVLSQPAIGDFIPYDLSVRGLIELDTESEIIVS